MPRPLWTSVSLADRALPVERSGDLVLGRSTHRLHVFSLDLSAEGLERAGGMGISVPCLPIELEVRRTRDSGRDILPPEIHDIGSQVLERTRKSLGISGQYEVRLTTPLYRHRGLGSTTQVGGLIAGAVAELAGTPLSLQDLSTLEILDAGSCVGLTLLSFPGVILDLGFEVKASPADDSYVPHRRVPGYVRRPQGIALHLQEPPSWWVVLVLTDEVGVSGQEELKFWSERLPTTSSTAHETAYRTLMDLVPAIVCRDLSRTQEALAQLSGLHTKRDEIQAQGSRTLDAMTVLREGFGFAGLSSLGPCLYSLSEYQLSAEDLDRLARALPARTRIWQFPLSGNIPSGEDG